MKKMVNRATIRVVLSCMIWLTLNAIILLPVLSTATSEMAKEDIGEAGKKDVSWRDYNGKRIGVLTGPLMEDAAAEYFPDSEYLIFNSYPDCMTALLAGKIDGYLGDEPSLKTIHAEQPAAQAGPGQSVSPLLARGDGADSEIEIKHGDPSRPFYAEERKKGPFPELRGKIPYRAALAALIAPACRWPSWRCSSALPG